MPTKTRAAQIPLRERILTAALQVLQSGGPHALTQPRVAKQAGIAQGHLTYYFPTRADLLAAVTEATSAALLAEYDALTAASSETRPDRIRQLVSALHSSARTRMLLGFVLAADEEPPIRDLFRRLTTSVRERLAVGLAQAGLRSDPDVAAMVHALCVGLAVLDLARGEKAATEDIGRSLHTAFTALRNPGVKPARAARRPRKGIKIK
jgi:AcrR family transcriptional regulator